MQTDPQKEIAAFLASLYFMNSEATKIGLGKLAVIFKEAINNVEIWLRSPENVELPLQDIVGLDLFNAMKFLEACSSLDAEGTTNLLETLEQFDVIRKRAS